MSYGFIQRIRIEKVSRPIGFTFIGVAILTLSACGIKGSLETPPPLWGDETTSKDETKKDDSVLDESPISKTNDEDNIFSDDYLENDEPF
jgi:predicted small lipoprotein YifL